MVMNDNQIVRMIAQHFVLLGVEKGLTEYVVDRSEIRMYGGFTPKEFNSYFPFIVAYIQQRPIVHDVCVHGGYIVINYYKEYKND